MKQRAALTISYILMPTSFAAAAFLLLAYLTPQTADRAVLVAVSLLFGSILPFFLIVLSVAWARVELKAHTRAQVVAGAFLGIVPTAAQVQALYRIAGVE